MSILPVLLPKLLPLYGLIFLGYLAGTWVKIPQRHIASFLIYIINPIIAFNAGYGTSLEHRVLLIPFITFTLSASLSTVFYHIVSHFRKDGSANVISFMAGQLNTGYFGIPIAYAVLPPEGFPLYILAMTGMTVSHYTVAAYFIARGTYTARESIISVVTLPFLYTLIAGILFQLAFPSALTSFLPYVMVIKSAEALLVLLGMSFIGLSLVNISFKNIDYFVIVVSMAIKFLVWPILAIALITVDQNIFHIYDDVAHTCLWLISMMPIAANSVAFATKYDVHPDKAGMSVLLSTILALFFIPLVIGLY